MKAEVKTEINSRSKTSSCPTRPLQTSVRDANHSLLSFGRLRAPEAILLEQMNSSKRKSPL